MYKKLIIFTVIAMPLPCSAGWFMDWFKGAKTPAIPLPHVPLAPQQLAEVSGGVASSNTLESLKQLRGMVKDVMDNPEAVEKAACSFTKGLAEGPFYAARDGAVYAKDTAVAHPYITVGALTAGIGAAAYYKFRPLTEEEQRLADLKKAKLLADFRAAKEIEQTDAFSDEYRTCLNRHAYDENSSPSAKLKRCHSPARRLAMLNPAKADQIASAFKKCA